RRAHPPGARLWCGRSCCWLGILSSGQCYDGNSSTGDNLPFTGMRTAYGLSSRFAQDRTPVRSARRRASVRHLLLIVHESVVLGGTRGWHHDSIPSRMAAVFNWGRASHLWETELRTDFSLVNPRGGQPMNPGFQPQGLRDFDAIVIVSATGDWGLDAGQKAALLDFVRAGGGL